MRLAVLEGDLFPAGARFYRALFVFDVVADGGSGAGDAVPGIFTPFFDEGLFFAGGDVNILSGMKGGLFRRIDFRGSGVDLTAGVERDVFAGGQGRAEELPCQLGEAHGTARSPHASELI